MKKKLVSSLLAMVLIIGSSTVVKAEPVDTEGSGSVTPAIIDVEIPTKFDFKLDPFNVDKGGKVVTSALTIENKSNVPVAVEMSGIQVAGEGITFLDTAANIATETGKKAFLWLGNVTPTFDKDGNITAVRPTVFSQEKNAKQILSTEKSTETLAMGSLFEATYTDGEYTSTNAKGKMYLGVMGDVTSVSDWAKEDAVTVSATFDIVPQVVGSVK